MPLFHPNQSQQQLCQYLNRRKSTSQNQNSQTTNDFFTKTKYNSRKKQVKSKRFNTTQPQQCQIDFRIMTVYQPSDNYKFTGECFRTKYKSRKSMQGINIVENQEDEENEDNYYKGENDMVYKSDHAQHERELAIPKHFEKLDIQPIGPLFILHKQNHLTKSLLLSKTQSPFNSPQPLQKTKSSLKYQIKHPTPVKQAQFLIRIKQSFLKRHNLNQKVKSNNLIKIQDYLTEQKYSFKRKMQSELVRMGEAKLLSEIKQKKGKIYLSGLHGVRKKQKQVENIDKLLVKSRQSFSTPSKFISHLKLASQKKHKLQNIKQINHAKMQNCLEKIKSLNLKRDLMSVSIN